MQTQRMSAMKANREPGRFLQLAMGIIVAFIFAAAIGWADDNDVVGTLLELPPPPPLNPPAIDLSILGVTPERMDPQAPSVAAAWPTRLPDGQVEQMLAALAREAPRRSTLETMLFEQLRGALPEGGGGCLFDQVKLPDTADLPASGWEVRYDFHLPARGIGATPFSAAVTASDGRLMKRFAGSVWIDREAQGVQVTRLVRQGEIIRPADATLLKTQLSKLERGAFDDLAQVVGTVARVELRPGRWLTEGMLKIPAMVKRGQAVTIRLQRGPIRIATPGMTLQAGGPGEIIRVENAQSRREIFARVISKDEVQVID